MKLRSKIFTAAAGCAVIAGVVATAGLSGTPLAAVGVLGEDEFEQVHATLLNWSDQPLTLVSATHSGMGTHWKDQAPQTLPAATAGKPGQAVVSDYSAGGNEVNLEYQDPDGHIYTFYADDAATKGSSKITQTSTSPQYDTYGQWQYDETNQFQTVEWAIAPGHTFNYTGKADSYTVPTGVYSMDVTAIGGAGGAAGVSEPSPGAKITGTIAVTPGEQLTVGVGGVGNDMWNNVTGGWGLPIGSDSYSGGDGAPGASLSSGGGGASVIIDASTGEPVVIAGGAGGAGDVGCNQGSDVNTGGIGGTGTDGGLTGGNGGPNNQGGKGGANSQSQGQSQTTDGACAAGAGGGGLAGGLAGITGAFGEGGGAGSSFTSDAVSNVGVTNADWHLASNGSIVLSLPGVQS
ncbi:glycine-rich protein [Curtobacterium sp. MCPF17_002]|uniref:glycine-rich protein n=1 Tax=Curtobacterium sp. MCPF17_002 TaxID=2175645 RepID=UPI000DA7D747|nr:glycine-rich protein [Curtobacterium sp. MCPF17_002]WIB77003.1 glycine-rich protein [Curtobacterium sp. MCPF17_002]